MCKHPKERYYEKPFYGVNYPEQWIHLIDYKKWFSIDMAFLLLMEVCVRLNRGPMKWQTFPVPADPIYLEPWK